MASAENEDGWIHLNAERAWMKALQAINPFDFSVSDWWGLLLLIPATIVYFIVVALLIGTVPRPRINVTERKLRVGRRIFDFSDVKVAEVSPETGKRKNSELMFGPTRGPMLYVPLERDKANMVTDDTREVLRKLIEESGVPADRKRIALKALS